MPSHPRLQVMIFGIFVVAEAILLRFIAPQALSLLRQTWRLL